MGSEMCIRDSHRIVSRVDGAALVGRDCRGERVWGRFFFVSNRLFFLIMSGKCVRLVFENVPAKENAGMKEDGRPLSFSLKRFFGFSLAVVAPRRRTLGGFSHRASIVHPSDGRCFVVFRVSTAFFFVSQSSFCFFVSPPEKMTDLFLLLFLFLLLSLFLRNRLPTRRTIFLLK